jgi:hypothetical protein
MISLHPASPQGLRRDKSCILHPASKKNARPANRAGGYWLLSDHFRVIVTLSIEPVNSLLARL